MRKFLAIITCKLLRFIGKLVHKGSSLPGQIALKIDPGILGKVKLPKYIIAVSGSNGKTSTVEMIKETLTKSGFKVAVNSEGSNQIEGVTTLVLKDADIFGKCRSDVMLIESDERYARYTFKYITPTHFVITNLYRDQLTRNGNPEWIYNCLKDSIHKESTLILNGDDPLVSLFGSIYNNAIYYGIDKYKDSLDIGVYDDGAYCPSCKGKFKYAYRHFGNIGEYECMSCGYKTPKKKYHITDVDLNNAKLTIDEKLTINLSLKSLYNAYNILAAYSLCKELKVKDEVILDSLNNYVLKNGRVINLKFGNNEGIMLTSKHENSTSYNQSLAVVKNDNRDVSVIILVDAISRKYFTSETSWLWDINFNELAASNVKRVVLCGTYAYDLALRFEYTDVDKEKLHIYKDIDEAVNYLKIDRDEYVYAITCFSDMNKILDRVEVLR